MSGSWAQITEGEIGVGAPVTVPIGEGKKVDGVVDAIWIPARELQTFSGEVRIRVKGRTRARHLVDRPALPRGAPLMPATVVTIEVQVAVWVCDWCGTPATAPVRMHPDLAAQHFIDTLGWRMVGDHVACTRCRTQPDVATALIADAHRSVL